MKFWRDLTPVRGTPHHWARAPVRADLAAATCHGWLPTCAKQWQWLSRCCHTPMACELWQYQAVDAPLLSKAHVRAAGRPGRQRHQPCHPLRRHLPAPPWETVCLRGPPGAGLRRLIRLPALGAHLLLRVQLHIEVVVAVVPAALLPGASHTQTMSRWRLTSMHGLAWTGRPSYACRDMQRPRTHADEALRAPQSAARDNGRSGHASLTPSTWARPGTISLYRSSSSASSYPAAS